MSGVARTHGQSIGGTHDGELVLGGVAADRVAGDLEAGADHDGDEEPGPVPDEGLVEEDEERHRIDDGGRDGQREGGGGEPDAGFFRHDGLVCRT